MADSYVAWTATIKSLAPNTGRMSVLYETTDSDASRPGIYQSIPLRSDQWNDSDIRAAIKLYEPNVISRWNTIVAANTAADSASFNDSDFIGLVVTDDYKPTVSGTTVTNPNPLIYKIVTTDSEEAQQIVRNQSLVALDSDEKVAYRQSLTFDKRILFQQLVTDGYYDSVENSLATGEPISASWDASSGAAFDWSTDKLASRGIRTVTREAEGTYRVYFSNPMPDSNWTAVTGVGADDYSGAGGSPRQLTVLRTGDNVSPNYVTVHCERTDDAVNEDNAYMSVMVAYPSSTSSTEVAWNNQTSVTLYDSIGHVIQNALGLNDSDFASYMVTNVTSYS